MTRSYKGVFIKKNRVYSVEDLKGLYRVTANTVSNWVGEGLSHSDGHKPYLFQGAFVQRFHKQRRERLAKNLRPGEFKCTGCKSAVFPDIETVQDVTPKSGKHMYTAICPDCEAHLWKLSSETDRDIVEDCRNPNTTSNHLHEINKSDAGGIWIKEEKFVENLWFKNDRIIYKWQIYAERYDEKTIDRHLSAIRYCEEITGGKCFIHVTIDDVSRVRNDLKRRAQPDEEDCLSASSIRHIISHLAAFFNWLLKQDGYKRLPKDIADYFKLPKAVLSSALQTKDKEYPSIIEAEAMLRNMSCRSLMERRARALFALAFLGALRADTLISLRIMHVDMRRERIVQDAKVVHAKDGKATIVKWFPIPKSFANVVVNWLEELKNYGFKGEDALFPRITILENPRILSKEGRANVLPMSTKHAVTKAFAIASRDCKIKYTPHAVKHTIAAERDARHLTHKQRKAWSENLGHENEHITETHYGKFTDDQRAEVLESIREGDVGSRLDISDEEKVALVDEVLAILRKR